MNQTSDAFGSVGGGVDGDSLYPVLFEDLLSFHLPVGGENFKYQQLTTGIAPRSTASQNKQVRT